VKRSRSFKSFGEDSLAKTRDGGSARAAELALLVCRVAEGFECPTDGPWFEVALVKVSGYGQGHDAPPAGSPLFGDRFVVVEVVLAP